MSSVRKGLTVGSSIRLDVTPVDSTTVPENGEIRYVDDDFIAYSSTRGWISLTAAHSHVSASGSANFLAVYKSFHSMTFAADLASNPITHEVVIQSRFKSDPVATLVLANFGDDYGGKDEPLLLSDRTYLKTTEGGYFYVQNNNSIEFDTPTLSLNVSKLKVLDITVDLNPSSYFKINGSKHEVDENGNIAAAVLSIQNRDVNITTFDLLAKSSNLTRIHSLNVLSLKSNRKIYVNSVNTIDNNRN